MVLWACSIAKEHMELRDYLRIVRSHWVVIILGAVLGALLGFGWASLQSKVYTAEANGYVLTVNSESSPATDNNLAMSMVKSYVEMGSWRSVAQNAINTLGLDTTPEALVKRVSVSNPLNTVIIEVRATGPTPEEARDLASAWVQGMQTEIERIETSAQDGAAPRLRLEAADLARLPDSPTSPNTTLAVVVGGLLGLVAAACYAFLRSTLDRRVRSPEIVERQAGLTVVGAIPEERSFTAGNRTIPFDGAPGGKGNRDLHAVSEAMRELRTNIQFMDVDNPPRTIVVTSALPGEGKSTISANLAIALAESGEQVVLIDGDLRRPVIADTFGLPGDVGLTDVLSGRASIADIAQPVGLSGHLVVIAAGRIPPNPSELLGSRRMHDLVVHLADSAMVIVDAPPLLPVTDAAALGHNMDGAILVTRAGKTTVDALQEARTNLERAGGRPLGVVLNRVPRKGTNSYHGYRYSGDYYRSPEGVEGHSPTEQGNPTSSLPQSFTGIPHGPVSSVKPLPKRAAPTISGADRIVANADSPQPTAGS